MMSCEMWFLHLYVSFDISIGLFSTSPATPVKWHSTEWRRLIGPSKLQIIFHKRATKYRSLLQKMTYKDKGSCESSPPCRHNSRTNELYLFAKESYIAAGEFFFKGVFFPFFPFFFTQLRIFFPPHLYLCNHRKSQVTWRSSGLKMPPRVAVCCSVLQCVAVRCSALQCVSVRCSVLQCVAVCDVLQSVYKYIPQFTWRSSGSKVLFLFICIQSERALCFR